MSFNTEDIVQEIRTEFEAMLISVDHDFNSTLTVRHQSGVESKARNHRLHQLRG